MYMDGIKLFAKNEKELETLMMAVRIYSDNIGMEFGIEKYAIRTNGIYTTQNPSLKKRRKLLGDFKIKADYLQKIVAGTGGLENNRASGDL